MSPRSLRLRIVYAVLTVAIAPQLLVFAWSLAERNVPGQMWAEARDVADEAARLVLGHAKAEELQALAKRARVRIRVVERDGRVSFDADHDDPSEAFDRVESFFLGRSAVPALRELDDARGPIASRPEYTEARRTGVFVGCEHVGLLFCQAARAVPDSERIVYVQNSSHRPVQAVYALRFQLLRIGLLTLPIAVLLAWYTGRLLVRPLDALRRQALDHAGRATTSAALVTQSSADEVGDLASALNALLGALAKRRKEHEASVADLVHELKNPVATVRACAEALSHPPFDRERAERLSRALHQSSTKLDQVVTHFLELARAEAGLPAETREEIDLVVLLRPLVSTEVSRVVVRATFPEGPVRVRGIEHRLATVFRELIDNATSFASATVHVSVASGPIGVVVRVEDDGPGIAESDLPRVFERFFTTRGEKRGTGLGLALVKAVIEAHGGHVAALSHAGQGASFVVSLPSA